LMVNYSALMAIASKWRVDTKENRGIHHPSRSKLELRSLIIATPASLDPATSRLVEAKSRLRVLAGQLLRRSHSYHIPKVIIIVTAPKICVDACARRPGHMLDWGRDSKLALNQETGRAPARVD